MRIKAEITVCTYFAFSIFSIEQYVQEVVAHTWNSQQQFLVRKLETKLVKFFQQRWQVFAARGRTNIFPFMLLREVDLLIQLIKPFGKLVFDCPLLLFCPCQNQPFTGLSSFFLVLERVALHLCINTYCYALLFKLFMLFQFSEMTQSLISLMACHFQASF